MTTRLCGERCLAYRLRERRLADTDDERIGSECFAIEERGWFESQVSVELKMLGARDELGDVYT